MSARQGIVVEGTGGVWRVRTPDGSAYEAALAGRLKQEERGALKLRHVGESLGHPGEDRSSDLRMGRLPSAELDGKLDPIPRREELVSLTDLRLEVRLTDLGGTAKLLQVGGLLALPSVLLLLLGLVLELAVVEVFADRRNRGWGYLYEV